MQPTAAPNGSHQSASPADPTAVREQSDRVLASASFRTSKRHSGFLRYLVEETLEGRSAHLKERTVGVHEFGREIDYDTNVDPVVRVSAGELRKRLAQYYHEAGRETELRIDLPPGSEFRLMRPLAEVPSTELPASPARRPKTARLLAAGDFLSSPEYMEAINRQAPRYWRAKNVQAVVTMKIRVSPALRASWLPTSGSRPDRAIVGFIHAIFRSSCPRASGCRARRRGRCPEPHGTVPRNRQ